jgi:hypothetical protein
MLGVPIGRPVPELFVEMDEPYAAGNEQQLLSENHT